MKKIILIIGIIFAIIASITYVQAASATVELKTSSTSVKKGDTFTVTLSATCSAGINGVIADYTYDTDKLELVEHKAADKFMDLNGDSTSKIETMISSGSVTSADIFVLTFKIKDTAQIGETAAINVGPITVDSDTDGEATVQAKSVSVQVANQASSGDNDSNTNTVSNNTTTNNTITNNTATNTSTNTSGNNTAGTITNGNNNTVTNTSGKSNTTSTNTPAKAIDNTVATSILPKTGLVAITGMALVAVIVLAIAMFKKLKKYDGIK